MTTRSFPAPGGHAKVLPLGFGAMGLHAFYLTESPPQEDVDKLLDYLVDNAPSHPIMIDTSDIYTLTPGAGDNEKAIGNWLKKSGKRDKVFIATKFAYTPERKLACSQEDALKACDASLARLGVDYIDLYYCHRPDRHGVGVESSFHGLKQLKEQGKIRFAGCSEYSLEELKRCNEIVHVDAYQIEASPWTPEVFYSTGLSEWCKQNGTALVPYSPLGRGFLAGKFKSPEDIPEGDWRRHNPRFQGENFAKNFKIVEEINAIAQKKKVTPAQICLAWLMAQGDHIFPIPGTTNAERLSENLGSLKIKLSSEEEGQISKIVKSFKAAGERYPDAFRATLAF